MSTTTDANGTGPVSLTAILAGLILWQNEKQLPAMADVNSIQPHQLITIRLATLDDFKLWLSKLGGKRSQIRVTNFSHMEEDRHGYFCKSFGTTGWDLSIFVDVPRSTPAPGLDADTVAALTAVA